MPRYLVSVTRIAFYHVEAASEDAALDSIMDGEGEEVDGETTNMTAERICPTCNTELTARTGGAAANYCTVCERDVPVTDGECQECGEPCFLTETGVCHHGEPDAIDHDQDAAHVARLDEEN